MNRRVIATISMVAAFGLWFLSRQARETPLASTPTTTATPAVPPTPDTISPAPDLTKTPPPPAAAPLPIPSRRATPRDLSDPLVPSTIASNSPPTGSPPDQDTAVEFDKIFAMLRDYRTLFGENPVGTNSDIMQSIMGGNPKGAMLGPPEGQSVNDAGELLDPWGTPIFFHQLSADLMEIRSAGPDHTLWTADDLVR